MKTLTLELFFFLAALALIAVTGVESVWSIVACALFVGYAGGKMFWYKRGVKDSDDLHRRVYGVIIASHEDRLYGGTD